MQLSQASVIRRPKSAISTYSVAIFHLRNPFVTAWWSLAYPGFGHLRLGSTIKGVFFFVGELLINLHAKLNLAIIYSFTGNFAMAKQVLHLDLLLLYCGILTFAVWDSYRVALEINKFSVLADHENGPIDPMIMGSAGLNSLDKRNPWLAVAWSILIPGAGQLYCLALVEAFFMMIGAISIMHFSHFLPAVHYTFLGQFAQAKEVVDWQWLLNIPSFYCFSIYDAYIKAVELNKLFDQEQAQFLRNNYRSTTFKMPI